MKSQPLITLTPSISSIRTGPQLPASWQGLWDDYEVMKRSSLSPRTLTNYRETLAHLAAFLGLRSSLRRHTPSDLSQSRPAGGRWQSVHGRGADSVNQSRLY